MYLKEEVEREAIELYESQPVGPVTHGPPAWFELHESAKELWRNKARRNRRRNYMDTDVDDPDIVRI